jgi:hypothetical protein
MKIVLKLSVLFLICGLFLLGSCNSEPKHPAELTTADSLLRMVNQADSLFHTVNSEEVDKTQKDISYKLAYFQTNNKDTLKREQARILTEYHRLKRALSFYTKGKEEMIKAIKEEKLQCINLAHDLRNNTLEEKLDAKACVDSERKRVLKIHQSVAMIVPAVAASFAGYKAQTPGIDSIVSGLRANGGVEPAGDFKTKKGDDDDD